MNISPRWVVLIGCFIAYLFDAIEIAILALALPTMRIDLGLSTAQGGLLATATLLGIGMSGLTMGSVADRFGRKRPLIYCLLIFGFLSSSIAFVNSFELIMLTRFVSGLALGGLWGIVAAYVVETWPPQHRGRAVAFALSAFPLGSACAAVISGIASSWRVMFFIAGAGVVVPVLIVAFFFKESQEWTESRHLRTEQTSKTLLSQIFSREYLRSTLIGTGVCTLALVGWWGATTWLPTFLYEDKGIPRTTVSVFMTVLSIGMFIGYNFFGAIADKIGRKRAIVISLMGTGTLLPLYAVVASESSLFLLGPAFAFFAAFIGLVGAYLSEIFPAAIRVTGAGFCFNVGRGISALAPVLLGSLASVFGFGAGFVVCGALFIAAALLMLALPSDPSAASASATNPEQPSPIRATGPLQT